MKKILWLVSSLTAISAVCAAALAYVGSITAGPIAAGAERAKEEARKAVLCGEEGFAAEGRCNDGYGGEIVLMVGFRKDRRTVISYRVIKASETPGLGSKLSTPEFAGQFKGMDATSLKVKTDGGRVEAITSRAVCRAIEDARKRL